MWVTQCDKYVANKLKLLLAVLPSELLHIGANQLHMQADVYVWHSWYYGGYHEVHGQEQHLLGSFAGLFSVYLLAGFMVSSLSLFCRFAVLSQACHRVHSMQVCVCSCWSLLFRTLLLLWAMLCCKTKTRLASTWTWACLLSSENQQAWLLIVETVLLAACYRYVQHFTMLLNMTAIWFQQGWFFTCWQPTDLVVGGE